MYLLHEPHHDGSSLYVSDARPSPGDKISLWVRVPAEFLVVSVHARTTVDGEPRFLEAVPDPTIAATLQELRGSSAGEPDTWWRVELELHNPVTHYRFYLRRPDGEPLWLTAAGLLDHDLPDATDFRIATYEAPADWVRDAVIYQIFPDRFARSAAADGRELPDWAIACDWDTTPVIGRGPGTAEQIFGGDLDGIIEHLDHIESLGADTVYLTPIFPARSNHRYDASTFDAVDPLLGGDEALGRLADAVHARGMRLVGDITTNHCGAGHEWFTTALADPDAPERAMFYWSPDGDYVSWNGVRSLPKLNWNAELTRERMIGVLRRWLPMFDGWRVDVANMTGRYRTDDLTHEVAANLRAALSETAPEAMFVAEHMHDSTSDLDRDGWQGTMNYGGFTRPVWTWLAGPDTPAEFMGVPGGIPARGGESAYATIRAFGGRVSWRSLQHSWLLLDSHDAARIRTVTGSNARQIAAVALQATLPGPPMIFAGSEFGLTGWNGESSRTPMPWNRPGDRDESILAAYRALLGLRRSCEALRTGGLRWAYVSADVLAFLRETATETVLVAVRRGAGDAVALPGLGSGTALFGGVDLVDGVLPAVSEASAQIWRLV
ncbi:alpha-glucosidase [Allocatelliglobosispora scoriae]|uniref:Alpha-glucosidase n=1 Tax=Allocatelliglobosispora scoriae TaxID=643052 RepID=A0A841BSR0_9ACTN|nr:glycoside hydrolase family 13 protein [Allocatelliglobosispora scoriae]MBB5870428.1 alpha-glucosidase [Allocatelliglobosispora scoriae]